MSVGVFGKIPGHGDFIHRGLSSRFISIWDDWLQRSISSSQSQYGESWLEIYLTSPIWRFALSPGVIDNNYWAGIMVPSVDSVGRYFPLTIAKNIDSKESIFSFMQHNSGWYEALEKPALNALEHAITIEGLLESCKQHLPIEKHPEHQSNSNPITKPEPNPSYVIETSAPSSHGTSNDHTLIHHAYPALIQMLIEQQHPSFSAWHTSGGEYLSSKTAVYPGLPSPQNYSAFLDRKFDY